MKLNKQIRILCLLLICTVLTGISQPASAAVTAERILRRMGNLTQIPNKNLLIAQDSKTEKWGVYDTDANIVIPLAHENIQYVAYDVLSVSSLPEKNNSKRRKILLEEVNCHAVMTLDDKVLTDYSYGVIKAYSPQWIAGWVLEGGTTADHDFILDRTFYLKIRRCDIFYRGTDSTQTDTPDVRLIASLTRDQFKDAKAHGEYISIQNRDSGITVYNNNADIVDIGAKNLNSSVYGIKNWMLINLATGEMLMDGCSEVSEAQTEDELLLIATRIDFQGRKNNTLITTDGETVIPMCNAKISSVSRDYALITSNDNGKNGLYSCRERRMILPCEYDEILENKNAVDRFNGHGYIVVKLDEQYYCYELATRTLIPVTDFETNSKIDRNGPVFFTSSKEGKTTTTKYAAPDGKVKSMYGTISKSRGSGYLLIAKFSIGTSVINWYGNNYLPQYYSKIIITDDDRIIVNVANSGYDLYRIPE